MEKPTRVEVVALRERVLEHHRAFRYLGPHGRTLLLLCDLFLAREEDDAEPEGNGYEEEP